MIMALKLLIYALIVKVFTWNNLHITIIRRGYLITVQKIRLNSDFAFEVLREFKLIPWMRIHFDLSVSIKCLSSSIKNETFNKTINIHLLSPYSCLLFEPVFNFPTLNSHVESTVSYLTVAWLD